MAGRDGLGEHSLLPIHHSYGALRLVGDECPFPGHDAWRIEAAQRQPVPYDYDLSIPWEHEIRLEERGSVNPETRYPICPGGDGNCLQEDCGGPEGWMWPQDNAFDWSPTMLYLCLALCTMFLTFSVGRYLSARTRLVEKTIDETIARKLSESPIKIELARMKEENGVMRNLLIDMVENETSISQTTHMSKADKARAVNSLMLRRREIFSEAIFTLQHTQNAKITAPYLKIRG
ncbi:hypothetical protein ACC696_35655 [Rhizobium ruizarguesonis]|uniref:Plasmid pRiA4b Orf3-like domain-containing protein n=1 Tax=Rhizobium ruizarguesonis TaxID=2081791 RepID=A0ABY1X7G3_9HYPH|nr:hypothetical protein [Rhizobium ruizarguesonis]TAX81155.1 hypothetical protein ELH98_08785 [Rhizobium ruizarguesonis]TBE22890.1 hypothetical protein ELH08_08275 [Rhizobium ruizarguesonis]